MAQKRMFDKTITNSDDFLELPDSSQVLYFHLSMNADDDGFINNWKSILRMTGTKEDDLKILISKQFVIPFESGVIVIKHWRINNYLRNDRHKETKFKEEFSQLSLNENEEYEIKNKFGIPIGNPDKNRIDKNSIEYNIYSRDNCEEKSKNQDCLENFIKLVIDYLNSRVGTRYSPYTKSTIKCIKERINESKKLVKAGKRQSEYKFDDFVQVIDNKVQDWKNTSYEMYLRPSTLFGSKFDEYLNQKDSSKPIWFDKKQEVTEMTSEEQKKLNAIMEKYK